MKLLDTRRARRRESGQSLVIFVLALGLAIIPGTALLLEGGNAYAHQRVSQNAADAMANAGATVLAENLGGAPRTDADVAAAMNRMRDANGVTSYSAVYTNVYGVPIQADGAVATSPAQYTPVGGGVLAAASRGVKVSGNLVFDTTLARAININSFTATTDATAITGPSTGGAFLPVVIPVSMRDCDGTGTLVSNLDAPWNMSNPGSPTPAGQEFIVPLCKTGGGSFMILDLDPTKACDEEVTNPTYIQFNDFPAVVPTDTGNDCARKVEEAVVAAGLQGKVVSIPICDGECSTTLGSGGEYHIIRIASFFLDYISYSNEPNNSACARTTSPTYGTSLVNIVGGNGSSGCLVGWFVRWVTSGPVGAGPVTNGERISVQLIR